VVPGLGQFINRQWRKGLIFLVAIPALVAFLVFRYNSSIFNWVLTLAVVTLFASVFDAALYSIPAETRKTFQIPHFVSLACFVAAVFFLAAMLFFNELNRLYLFASIRQNWADPKLSQGEVIIVDRGAYAVEAPRRGDYVVAGGGAQMGKVVGLPGEEVELRDGKVFVGGSALPEAQYGYRELVDPRMRHFVLPGDGYLILESFERYSIVIPAARHHFSGRIIGVYSPSENRRRIGGQER
jgi:signal peptidase I